MQPAASLGEILSSGERSFSFELFPPKTDEGAARLRAVRAQLAASLQAHAVAPRPVVMTGVASEVNVTVETCVPLG